MESMCRGNLTQGSNPCLSALSFQHHNNDRVIIVLDDFLSGHKKIGVIGLGYVGLPLLLAFDKYFKTVGYDCSNSKVQMLKDGIDETLEVGDEALRNSACEFTADPSRLADCAVIIVAVPTPIDDFKTPDLGPVRSATEIISKNMSKGTLIIYESTVYPGVTEEVCKPILESAGHSHGIDFHLGYSPERINPGDRERRLETIPKVVSGDSPQILDFVAHLYSKVIHAGVHRAASIRVAEAAKVIENIQRDVNIALVNELSILFGRLGIDTVDVLEAAGTKWNFIKMNPGLVGGHCIGVDPYYLTYKAEQVGYHPQIITSGRRINDDMPRYVAEQTVKRLIESGLRVKGSKILILGVTFKENVPDTRNSKVKDLIRELSAFSCDVSAADPYVKPDIIESEFGARAKREEEQYEGIVLAVPHKEYGDLKDSLCKLFNPNSNGVFIDLRARYKNGDLDSKILHWRL